MYVQEIQFKKYNRSLQQDVYEVIVEYSKGGDCHGVHHSPIFVLFLRFLIFYWNFKSSCLQRSPCHSKRPKKVRS